MALVSDRLRAARERAGLRIADVSATTRIQPAFLVAIENGEFDRLPGEFFARAFLRTYARELRLDPDEVVKDYDSERSATQVQEVKPVALPDAPPPTRLATAQLQAEAPRSRFLWPALAVVALVLITVSRLNPGLEQTGGTPAEAVGTTGVVEAAPAVAASGASAPERLRLDIRSTKEIWVTAYADQDRVLYRLLQPGEQVTLDAREQFSLRIGEAGAFEYAINGVPGKPLGAPGEVRDVRITRENYRTFQRSQ